MKERFSILSAAYLVVGIVQRVARRLYHPVLFPELPATERPAPRPRPRRPLHPGKVTGGSQSYREVGIFQYDFQCHNESFPKQY